MQLCFNPLLFKHLKPFNLDGALQEANYDTDTLAALLSPGSKCVDNLLQLSTEIAAGQTGSRYSSGTEPSYVGGDDTDTSRHGGCDPDIRLKSLDSSMPVFF